jgi:uncharacterized protein (DUF2225 family)
MNKDKAHDIMHMWYGGKSEKCPYCNHNCTDMEMIEEAIRIAADIAKPTINPNVPFEDTVGSPGFPGVASTFSGVLPARD